MIGCCFGLNEWTANHVAVSTLSSLSGKHFVIKKKLHLEKCHCKIKTDLRGTFWFKCKNYIKTTWKVTVKKKKDEKNISLFTNYFFVNTYTIKCQYFWTLWVSIYITLFVYFQLSLIIFILKTLLPLGSFEAEKKICIIHKTPKNKRKKLI